MAAEAVWGADPLQAYGGFHNLEPDHKAVFRSPLTTNATVTWELYNSSVASSDEGALARIAVHHSNVDWNFAREIYGWTALQYQTWIRGDLINDHNQTLKLRFNPSDIIEFHFNGEHFFGGDFFGFGRAPVVLEAHPGRNRIDIRLVREIRSMGVAMPPDLEVDLVMELVKKEVIIMPQSFIFPDLLHDDLASTYASMTLVNQMDEEIEILGCVDLTSQVQLTFLKNETVSLHPGQLRPLKLSVELLDLQDHDLELELSCKFSHQKKGVVETQSVSTTIIRRNWWDPHKITFQHPSGVISYAILRPPSSPRSTREEPLPILLALHGAGLEADSPLVRHALDNCNASDSESEQS